MREVPLDDDGAPSDGSGTWNHLERGDRIVYRHQGRTWQGTVKKVQRRTVAVEPDVHSELANVPKKDIVTEM